MRSIWRDHGIYLKRVWDQQREILKSNWRELNIYMERSWDLNEERIRSV